MHIYLKTFIAILKGFKKYLYIYYALITKIVCVFFVLPGMDQQKNPDKIILYLFVINICDRMT